MTTTVYYPADTSIIYPSSGGGGGADTHVVESRVITAPEASAQQITLTDLPIAASQVIFMVQGAPTQVYSDDYTVSGNVLSWAGLGLDSLIAAGDTVIVLYWT